MSIPLTPPGKTLEAVRSTARQRFFLAAALYACGTFLLSVAQPFLSASPIGQIGFLTGLILACLLIAVGLAQAVFAASAYRGAFPLNPAASAARQSLLASLAVILPLAVTAAGAWLVLALPGTPIAVLPSVPLFWAPLAASACIGFVYAARELASERMALVAAVGAGIVVATAVSPAVWSLANPDAALEGGLVPLHLFLQGWGFLLLASAFRADAWIARSGRRP